MINLIVACDNKWGIGLNNDLIYRFPSDLKRFKELTTGKIIVMGRKTWESLPNKLPNRRNIVITSSNFLDKTPDEIYNNIHPVLEMSKTEEVWVIGGADMIKHFMPYITNIELTLIDSIKEADVDISFLDPELSKFHIHQVINSIEVDSKSGEEMNLQYITYKRH